MHEHCKADPANEYDLGGIHEGSESAGNDSFDGSRSLYTFEEALESSTMLGKEPSPKARRSKSKKSLPLLKLHSLVSEKRHSLQTAPVAGANSNSPQSQASLAKQSEQTSRFQKKLKKPMPHALKKQRNGDKTITKDAECSVELSTVPEGLAVAHVRRVRDEVIGDADLSKGSVDHPPVEPNAENPESRWSLFSRSRSKSRSRGRSNSVRQSVVDLPDSPEAQKPGGTIRERSKSESRTRSLSVTRPSAEDMTGSCGSAPAGRPIEVGMPASTIFAPGDRAVGGESYETSTNMAKRATAPVPGTTQHSVQSPLAVSTGLLKTKSRGMTPEMASELARMKSRDFAPQAAQDTESRPRMAMSKHFKSKSRSSAAPVLERRVEDYFPDWQSKPTASHPAPAPGPNRPYSSYAESVPPLPELPVDVMKKAHRAGEIIAKKSSARSTPTVSARNSVEMSQARPASGKKARSSSRVKTQQELTSAIDSSTPGRQIVPEQTGHVDYALRAPTHKEADTCDVTAEKLAAGGQASRPNLDSTSAGWPGWEQQATLWRDYQRSLHQQVDRHEDGHLPRPESPPLPRQRAAVPLSASPSIVVSRYITPLAAESAARANAGPPSPSHAAQNAEAYRGSIGDDKENRPAQLDIPKYDSAVSSDPSNATFVTVKSWDPGSVKPSVPRSDSSVSTNTHTTTVTTTATFNARPKTTSAQRSRTASGPFTPYSPTQAAAAERSRTERLARPDISGPGQDAASLAWLDESANSSTTSLGTPCGPRQPKKGEGPLHDRYSGGLGYGWDRASGFGGSAGTRTSGCEGNRKSVHMSEQFGIDLSDVPIFLQRRSDQ
ncbi:hypothetical protein Tdes44962_MAKER07330 [Teratosphaeria destructans]|uniref:Uncharacterized protein n=1 Tax=Teratosphaeria destructans TaxID=418781 RepID=A0A9W7W6D3_9PEZI|nr:hypothetical protein Tdes44962_MAKER07330 [Teratosphaeria destructans]